MSRGIIFDVDGTMWDACQVIADSWNAYLRLHYPQIPANITYDTIRGVCGKTMDVFAREVFPDLEEALRLEVAEGCCQYEVEYMAGLGGEVYPYLIEVIRKLSAKYPLYIVSNCQNGYVEDFLMDTQTEAYFADVEYYGRTLRPKHENIALLMERNHLEKAIYLGDTQGDYESASAAGAIFVHAAYGFGEVDGDVPKINDLRELEQLADGLLG